MTTIFKKNPLFFGFLFPALVDGVTTLIGQGKQYWGGSRIVSEASPAYYFLLASPIVFILGSIIWFVFWYWAFKKISEPLNLILMLLFVSGHSWGGGSWIAKMIKSTGFMTDQIRIMIVWIILIGYFLISAVLAAFSVKSYFCRRR